MWGEAQHFITSLEEKEPEFRVHAVMQLLEVVETEWIHIIDYLPKVEECAKDESFPKKHDAALLASKTYYFLGKLEQAVEFAILSGDKFDYKNETDSYCVAVTGYIFTLYKKYPTGEVPKLLFDLCMKVLDHLVETKNYASALCISVDIRNIEYIERVIDDEPALIPEAIRLLLFDSQSLTFSDKLSELLALKATTDNCEGQLDLFVMLLYRQKDAKSIADVLDYLIGCGDVSCTYTAYSICFEISQIAPKFFRDEVIACLEQLGETQIVHNLINIINCNIPFYYKSMFMKNNASHDKNMLKHFMDLPDEQHHQTHMSVTICYAISTAGTCNDELFDERIGTFFVPNRDSRFSFNYIWSDFCSGASCVLTHQHNDNAYDTNKSYVNESAPSFLGGVLLALGIDLSRYCPPSSEGVVLNLLRSKLDSDNPQVRYGASLGYSLMKVSSAEDDTCKSFMETIVDYKKYEPEVVESVAYSLGIMLMKRGKCDYLDKLISVLLKSESDKVCRGIALAIGFIMYDLRETINEVIEPLQNHSNSYARLAAVWAISMAYIGSDDDDSLMKLLQYASTDPLDEVKRASVIGMAFVVSGRTNSLINYLNYLVTSFHPFVRAATALSLGIAYAGSGNPEAVALIKPLLEERNSVVLQHAYIGLSLILQQHNPYETPFYKEFFSTMQKRCLRIIEIGDIYDSSDLFGICLAFGILNAGGRNVVASLKTLGGQFSRLSVASMAIFTNYYYFIPLSLLLPLTFQTTFMIGMTEDDQGMLTVVSDWEVKCNCKRKVYHDPPSYDESKTPVKRATPELSVKAKVSKVDEAEELKRKEEEEFKRKLEEEGEVLKSPFRVYSRQLPHIDTDYSDKYETVGKVGVGFVMLKKRG